MDKFVKTIVATVTMMVSWLALSFIFFPLEMTTQETYFAETMVYMIPLKSMITAVFTVFAVFMYEQKMKKRVKENN
jgi:hypothetical protein